MKNLIPFLYLIFLISCSGSAQKNKKKVDKIYTIMKTEVEWKKQLTSMQYYVLREAGTERSFTSPLNNNKENGLYVCAACNTPLYDSNYKFDSGSGWPSFDRAISNNVELDVDYKIGYARTELKCATCGGHLGHSFNDGPKNTTGERHCINGVALKFVKE
ncbi:peptide-methionine (R)-S-oxide reductase MsrB [Flavobacteriaceae bacterium]|jgi:peptide-methionine (R)-S-oxide reductase|nr:peptide-methionine (R)-S-oxide reductase MsrB [Flavobacteriaceae bacterium]MDB2685229.1 peptide-methionine (R)-S-oxide reductase MsrB [Flavobacteriaceae bacterium]MDC3344706.1 peptide-methionine (R)-S-oxide reductase MsrB [Flavobacteriaceae bacterium]|tara:strand:- start:162 stop:641 length:480 start_codon:yes stop_codon:yes gene_type:complete